MSNFLLWLRSLNKIVLIEVTKPKQNRINNSCTKATLKKLILRRFVRRSGEQVNQKTTPPSVPCDYTGLFNKKYILVDTHTKNNYNNFRI